MSKTTSLSTYATLWQKYLFPRRTVIHPMYTKHFYFNNFACAYGLLLITFPTSWWMCVPQTYHREKESPPRDTTVRDRPVSYSRSCPTLFSCVLCQFFISDLHLYCHCLNLYLICHQHYFFKFFFLIWSVEL